MRADEARRQRRRGPRGRRPSAAVHRRRRLVAALVLLALAAVVVFALRSDDDSYSEVTPKQLQGFVREADPVRFTVSASGDILIHTLLWERALANGGGSTYDFTPFFEEIAPWVAGADLALCHQETTLGPPPPASYPLFNTPEELATSIRESGWDACDTASNHALDQGEEGIASTVAAFERAGVRQTGSFTSPGRRERPTILRVKGAKLGLVAYTDATNGIPLPQPWAVNLSDTPSDAEQVIADARRARRAGAEAVIVNMHWGDENSTEPNELQLELADRLTRSPAIDVIVAQGPHVVQPIRRVNGKFVIFSEGNLVSNQSPAYGLPAETQDGLVALLDFVADGDGVRVERVRYVPTWVRPGDYVVLPARPSADPAYADSLRDSYERTVGIVGSGRGFGPLPAG